MKVSDQTEYKLTTDRLRSLLNDTSIELVEVQEYLIWIFLNLLYMIESVHSYL